jgi:hypothetical protein
MRSSSRCESSRRQLGAPPSFGAFQLPEEASRLTPAQRKAVKHVVEVMLESNTATGAEAPPLRAVASGRSGRKTEAAEEARAKARKAREDG